MRKLPQQQRELLGGVAPADIARRIRFGQSETLCLAQRHLEGGALMIRLRIALEVPLRMAVSARTREASGRRSNVPRKGMPAMQLAS